MVAARRPIRTARRTRRRSAHGQSSPEPGPAHTLARAVATQIATLGSTAANPRTHLTTLVHEVRLATKTLRAYVRLLEAAGTNHALHALSDRLRHIALKLGGARDAVVVRRTLRSLARKQPDLQPGHGGHGLPETAAEPQRDPPLTRAALRRMIRELGHVGRALQREMLRPHPPRPFAKALAQQYTSVRVRSKRQRGKPDPDAWHRWRKRTKAFYYQLAWLGRALPRRLRRLARRAWKLQRDLGAHHDLILVRTHLDHSGPHPCNRHRHRRLIELCDVALRRTEKRVNRRARRFTRLDPRTFATLATRTFTAANHR